LKQFPQSEGTPIFQYENFCQSVQSFPPDQQVFKGMELYSWQNEQGEWIFNILFGTNRQKSINEVRFYKMETNDVGDCICRMPQGETVFWVRTAQDDFTGDMLTLPTPPEKVIEDIRTKASQCGVKLIIRE
jgi:hypothetical protein